MEHGGRWWAVLLVFCLGCAATPGSPPPAPADPSPTQTGGTQATPDAGLPPADAPDAGMDGGSDAGTPSPTHAIETENQLPGTTAWKVDRGPLGMGAYTDKPSYSPGDWVDVHAAAPGGTTASWTLFRLGYYGGAGGRALLSGTAKLPDATPGVMDPATGAVSANWPTALRFQLPTDAVTGTYLVKLSAGEAQTTALLVVREPTQRAKILVNIAVDTYQAYNTWGGTSLYDNFRSDWPKWHAFAVSFDRPYARGNGAGNFFLNGDRELVTFLEGQGFEVAYVTDVDLDEHPELLHGRTLIVIAGHSEYWTAGMRDGVEAANAAGTHLAFLGANDAYWQVRFATPAHRLLDGYKEFCTEDPAMQTDPAHATCRWRDPPVGRPEDALIGEMFGDWVWTSTPLEVTNASSWVWAGANVSNGERIPGVFGEESDREFESSPDTDEVAEGTVEDHVGTLSEGQTVVSSPANGRGTVFAAGTLQWCRALTQPGAWDVRIQQATANVLTKLGEGGALPAVLKPLTLGPGAPHPIFHGSATVSTVTHALEAPSAVAMTANGDALVVDGNRIVRVTPDGAVSLFAGSEESGNAVGAAANARFANPRGIAVGPDGSVYVADTWNNAIKVIRGGVVSVLAGSEAGYADGQGTLAKFNVPTSLAWAPSGVLLVADTWNHRIRAVTPTAQVTTYAGSGQCGATNGPALQASFDYPFGIAVAADGTVHVVEAETGQVRVISAGRVDTELGALSRVGWQDGPVATASVSETVGDAVSPSGQLILLDGASARIRAVASGQLVTLAGGSGEGDGPGVKAGFGYPRGAAFAKDGSLWVVDVRDHALRRVTFSP